MKKKLFARTGAILASCAALALLAGSVQAAAPVKRAGGPALITQVNFGAANADIIALYTTGGAVNQPLTLILSLDSGTAAANGGAGSAVNGTIGVNGGNPLVIGNATPANNHIIVYTGSTATPVPNLATATAVLGDTGSTAVPALPGGIAQITVNLPAPGANKGYRINGSGALEFSANTAAASPTWTAVNVDINLVTGKEIYTENNATAGFTAPPPATNDQPLTGNLTGIAVQTALVPTPVVTTIAAAGASIINGIQVDTISPINNFANVTNFTLSPAAGTCDLTAAAVANAPGNVFVAADATAATGGAVAATKTSPGSAPNKITLTASTTTSGPAWTAGTATDNFNAGTSTKCFNTGVVGGGPGVSIANSNLIPFTVAAVLAAPPTYTQVFGVTTGTGLPLNMANIQSSADDGVAPVVVKAAVTLPDTNGNAMLKVTFSEKMDYLGINRVTPGTADQALREVAENITLNTDSLAALNLNAGGSLSLSEATTNGQTTLSISGLRAADVAAKTFNMSTGIALVEPNDAAYMAAVIAGTTTQVLDLYDPHPTATPCGNAGDLNPNCSNTGPNNPAAAPPPAAQDGSIQSANLTGGYAAVRGATDLLRAPSATGLTIGTATRTIDFGSDQTTAVALPVLGDETKIGSIVVSFTTGNEVKLGTGFVAGDLGNNLVVQVNGKDATHNPTKFQFHPAGINVSLNATGSKMLITLPTNLIYANISEIETVDVQYLGGTGTPASQPPVLVGFLDSSVIVVQAPHQPSPPLPDPGTPGTEPVILPLSILVGQAASDSLLTQRITGSITDVGGPDPLGSRLTAYLAMWVDGQNTLMGQPLETVSTVRIMGGNVTNGTDTQVGKQLAIEFIDQGNLEDAIKDQLNAVYAAQSAVSGVSDAVSAGKALPITVYVKMIRSNDSTANGTGAGLVSTQVYLNGRALLATTYDGAKLATGPGQKSGDDLDPIYEVSLNPSTGALSGRMTGTIVIKADKASLPRGLIFIGQDGLTTNVPTPIGQTLVRANGAYNLLVGIGTSDKLHPAPNPTGVGSPPSNLYGTNLNCFRSTPASTSCGAFLLLVHEQPGTVLPATPFTLLTSANPAAANFMLFNPNLLSGLSTISSQNFDLTKFVKTDVVQSTNWAMYGQGNPAMATPAPAGCTATPTVNCWSFPRVLVGVGGDGSPAQFWDVPGPHVACQNLALTMVNGSIKVATQQGTPISGNVGFAPACNTLSTITNPFGVPGAVAFGWEPDAGVLPAVGHLDVLQSATTVAKVGKGWSLVSVPLGGLNTGTGASQIQAVIKVGAQADNQFTWVMTDPAFPPAGSTVTPGEGLFVFCNAASCNVAP